MSDYLFASTRRKLSLFEQLFNCDNLFDELAYRMIDEEDTSMCCFLDSWIDEKIQEEFSEFDWEACSRVMYSAMSNQDFVDYANELGIPIAQEVLDEMFVLD